MKNNLLALKSFDIDTWLPAHNDFLELVITSKMEEGEFVDIMNEIKDILERDYTFEDEDEDDMMDETEPFYYDRLKTEFSPSEPETVDSNANHLLYAGYADCMEEAIRFLVEEENISPEHPVVKNLKIHLEKSKDRILESLSFDGENLPAVETESTLNSIYLETFQSCRDSG